MTAHLHDDGYDARPFAVGLWRKLFRYTAPYRREITGLVLLAIATAAIDALFPSSREG